MAKNNTAMISIVADNADLRQKLSDSEKRLKGLERQVERTKKGTKGAFDPLSKSADGTAGPFGKLRRGLKGVGKAAKDTEGPVGHASHKLGGIGEIAGSLKSPLGAAGAAMAGLGLAAVGIEQALSATENLARATNRLKRETGLSAEEASAYIGIASRFGVTADGLSLSFGMLAKKMRIAVGDTKQADKMRAAFEDIGVSAASLNQDSVGPVLKDLADAFESMPDGAAKTAAAMTFFGKSGKKLIPILNQGRGGLKELQQKMKDFGLTMGDEDVKDTKELGKAQNDLKQVWQGLQVTLGKVLLPVLTKVMKGFSDFIVALRTGKKPTTDIGKQIMAFSNVCKQAGQVVSFLWPIVRAFFNYLKNIVGLVSAVVHGKWGAMWHYVKALFTSMVVAITTPMRALLGFIIRLAGTIGSKVLGGLRVAGRAIVNFARSVLNSARNHFGGVISLVTRIPRSLISLAGRFVSAGRHLGQAFVNAIGSSLNATGKFLGNIGRSIANWINDHTLFGDKIHLGPIDVNLPKLAKGGIVSGGRIAMIGEDGPEAVVPLSQKYASQRGQIMAAAGLGGGSNTFVVNNYGNQLDERALAARFAWQMQTRTA
jgi:hypothetical protein